MIMIKANLGLGLALLGMVLIVTPFILAPSSNINPMAWIGLIYVGLGITFLGARTLDA
jgi:drug/metabolite transporter (DMT)-like permease